MTLKSIEYIIKGIVSLTIAVGLFFLPRIISIGPRIDYGPFDF